MINGPSIYPPAGRILQVPEPPGTAQVRVRSDDDEITNSGCSVSGSAARAETKFPSRATLTARAQCGRPSSDICLFFFNLALFYRKFTFTPVVVKILSLDHVVGVVIHGAEITRLSAMTHDAEVGRQCLRRC